LSVLTVPCAACGVTSNGTTTGAAATATSATATPTTVVMPQVQPPRAEAAVAYDAARQQLVLFGGSAIGDAQTLNDTWIFGKQGWGQVHPASSPPGWLGSMVFDAATQQIVLVVAQVNGAGSVTDETWTWDGTTWTQQHPATTPALMGSSMAYDAATQQVILFGGGTPSGHFTQFSAATWAWNGATWAQLHPPAAPSGRIGASMTYDAARQRILLYGGYGQAMNADTWTWDGATWTQAHPATTPPARLNAILINDAATQEAVLFGGVDPTSQTPLSDTWSWNGTTWAEAATADAPNGPGDYDATMQAIIVYTAIGSGKAVPPGKSVTPTPGTGATAPASQTWLWNGSAWMQAG
jgi:hypothetical protein